MRIRMYYTQTRSDTIYKSRILYYKSESITNYVQVLHPNFKSYRVNC